MLSRELNECLAPYDLTRNHWVILGCLWQSNGIPVNYISNQVQQVGGTISGVLDRMEKRRLIKRKRDRKDKRIWRVFLTDSGSDLINVLPPLVKLIWDRAFRGMPDQEQARFSDLINLGLRNCCPDYFAHLPDSQTDSPSSFKPILPPHSLGYRIKLLTMVMGRIFVEQVNEYNVTVSHWIVLCRLWQEDGVSVSEVGEYIEQVGGTLTGVLERMEERGLIQRRQNDRDKRCREIYLTNTGASLVNVLPPVAKGVLDTMSKGMTESDIDFLSEFVDRLTANLSSH